MRVSVVVVPFIYKGLVRSRAVSLALPSWPLFDSINALVTRLRERRTTSLSRSITIEQFPVTSSGTN